MPQIWFVYKVFGKNLNVDICLAQTMIQESTIELITATKSTIHPLPFTYVFYNSDY